MKKLVALSFAFIAACAVAPAVWAQAPAGGAASGVMKTASLKGAENGKVAMCIGCHGITGYQASFPEVYKVPKIAGQNAAYIVAALTEYRKGERRHPTMRSIAAGLSDVEISDLANYYENLGHVEGKELVAVDPQSRLHQNSPNVGSALVVKLEGAIFGVPNSTYAEELVKKGGCVSCHGVGFSAPIAAGYPKLAGQYEDYLYVALKSYQVDHNDRIGRSNAIMMGMAKPYTHAELKALAAYISSLPGDLKTVQQSRFR